MIGSDWATALDLAQKWLDGARKARRGGFGVKKKTCLLNGLSSGNGGGPAGWVRASKNQPRTWFVAIPKL